MSEQRSEGTPVSKGLQTSQLEPTGPINSRAIVVGSGPEVHGGSWSLRGWWLWLAGAGLLLLRPWRT